VRGCVFELTYAFPNIKRFSTFNQEISRNVHPTLGDIPLSSHPPIQKWVLHISVCVNERPQKKDLGNKRKNEREQVSQRERGRARERNHPNLDVEMPHVTPLPPHPGCPATPLPFLSHS